MLVLHPALLSFPAPYPSTNQQSTAKIRYQPCSGSYWENDNSPSAFRFDDHDDDEISRGLIYSTLWNHNGVPYLSLSDLNIAPNMQTHSTYVCLDCLGLIIMIIIVSSSSHNNPRKLPSPRKQDFWCRSSSSSAENPANHKAVEKTKVVETPGSLNCTPLPKRFGPEGPALELFA